MSGQDAVCGPHQPRDDHDTGENLELVADEQHRENLFRILEVLDEQVVRADVVLENEGRGNHFHEDKTGHDSEQVELERRCPVARDAGHGIQERRQRGGNGQQVTERHQIEAKPLQQDVGESACLCHAIAEPEHVTEAGEAGDEDCCRGGEEHGSQPRQLGLKL